MADVIYQASVYSRTLKYINTKGEEREQELFFALDPLKLMSVIAKIQTKAAATAAKSANPAKRAEAELTSDQQLQFIVNLATEAAGIPSDDGEVWEPWYNFGDTIVGKAFMTKLTASDEDRKEFAQKVIIDPFEAFVEYAAAEPGNSPKEVQEFQTMLSQLKNIFLESTTRTNSESLADRKARLARELASLGDDSTPEV